MHDQRQDDEITQPEPIDSAKAVLRLGMVERELSELWRLFGEAQPGLAAAQFAASTADSAFVGVAELRKMIREEMLQNRLTLQQEASTIVQAASNRTKLAVAFMLAMSTVCGATIGALMTANMSAARAEANRVAEERTDKKLVVLEHRDKLLCGRCADEAIIRRDQQIDTFLGNRERK